MTDTPARRGPGRPRKVQPAKDVKVDEPTAQDVARDKIAEAAPFLSMTAEAAAAHASLGDATAVAIPDAAIADLEADNDEPGEVDPADRIGMEVHPDATHVGFDDGSQYLAKDGKITKRIKKVD